MRIAMFGAGRIAPLHARTLAGAAEVSSISITDAVPERAERVAAELGLEHVASADAAMDAADAVVIVAATDAHAALIRAALARDLPTFCEKPLAGTLTESVALAAEIATADAPVQVGFQRRFDPAYVEARRLIASGELGDVYTISMRSHDPEPASEEFIASSGGMFSDLSIHDLDVLRYLSGREAVEVYCVGSAEGFPQYAKYDDYATAVALISLDGGIPVTLTWTRHDPLGHDVRAEVFGSRDSVAVGLGPRTPIRSVEPGVPPPDGPAWTIFLDRWDEAYRDELLTFAELAAGRIENPCTATDGVEALRLAEALTISARERRVVRMEEVPA
ncbi:MAG: Gfo/Idh/MocA family oxidoreductase [Candidatus Limnocylindrales bacterium]